VKHDNVPPPPPGAMADDVSVANLSMMWQIPQYVLVGAAEALTAVAESEFFYSFATPDLRSVCMAMRLGATALGGYFASAELIFVQSVTTWIPEDLNQGRLDLFYVSLACLLAANFCLFVTVARVSPLTQLPPDEGTSAIAEAPASDEEAVPKGSESPDAPLLLETAEDPLPKGAA
jgi:hypothetical protein